MCARVRIITLILVGVIAYGCKKKDPSASAEKDTEYTVSIRGTLEGGEGEMVILEEMAAREYIPLDTALCDSSGTFEISIVPQEVAFYVLRYGPSGYITLLLEPGERATISGPFENIDSYSVEGSKGSELLNSLALEHRSVLNALGEIARKNMDLSSSPDYSLIKPVIDLQFDSITNGFYEYSLQFIHENAGSLAILVALYNLYGQRLPVFYPDEDLPVYEFVDSALMNKYNGFEAVTLLNTQVNEAKRVLENTGEERTFKKGEIAPDFVSSRTDGSQLALSDLRGEYVLISFWAGWSRLSRDENPALKRVYLKYGKHPFTILQVSFDDNQEVWTTAIREDGLEWHHVSDLKRWDTPVADLYQVDKIPSNLLVDPSGRIIETNLFGDKILEKLELIFIE